MDRMRSGGKTSPFRTLAFAFCVLLFSLSAVLIARKDLPGQYSEKARQLWEMQDWHALRALGENLYETGRSDAEILYLAMLASRELNHTEGVRTFAQRVAQARPFNWKIERSVASLYRPDSSLERLVLFRARLVYLLSALLSIVVIWSLLQRRPAVVPAAILSSAGLTALLL